MHLDYCRSVRHRIEIGHCELCITACSDSSLRLSDLSAESGLHFGMPRKLQKGPAQRV